MSLWLRRQVTANYWINLKGLDKSNSTITTMFDDLWERVKEEKNQFWLERHQDQNNFNLTVTSTKELGAVVK